MTIAGALALGVAYVPELKFVGDPKILEVAPPWKAAAVALRSP
jgi:hypothetical protein